VKPGRMPTASVAADPRLTWRASWVNWPVLAPLPTCAQPSRPPVAADAGLVAVQHRRPPQRGLDRRLHPLAPAAAARSGLARRLRRERADGDRLTGRTAPVQHLMLAHHQPQRGQIPYLLACTQRYRGTVQRGLAACAHGQAMLDHVVGCRHQPQRLAAIPELPARPLPTACPQALCLPFEPVAGRRFTAVVSFLVQPCLQLLHTRAASSSTCSRSAAFSASSSPIQALGSGIMPLGYACWARPPDLLPRRKR